jgi:hypothetical protein
MDLSNALIYGDRLRCGSSEIANAKLEFSGLNCCLPWLEDVRILFQIHIILMLFLCKLYSLVFFYSIVSGCVLATVLDTNDQCEVKVK